MRIEDDEPPIKTHPASKEYRENWEATFGEKVCEECGGDPNDHCCEACPTFDTSAYWEAQGRRSVCFECSGTGCVIDPLVDPSKVVTEGDLLKNCPRCTK